jgi:hypothetical protein
MNGMKHGEAEDTLHLLLVLAIQFNCCSRWHQILSSCCFRKRNQRDSEMLLFLTWLVKRVRIPSAVVCLMSRQRELTFSILLPSRCPDFPLDSFQLKCTLLSWYTGCRCVDFDDGYTRHRDYGIFTSPNWPSNYKSSGRDYGVKDDGFIDCLLYFFHAKENQIVQLSFDSLDLQKPPLPDE